MSNEKPPKQSEKTWVQKMADRPKKAFNDDNNKAKGKSPYEAKPASTSIKTETQKQTTPKKSFIQNHVQKAKTAPKPAPSKGPKR